MTGKLKNIIAGFAGAIALNVLHECLKKQNNEMPRIDDLGEEALNKGLSHIGEHIDNQQDLYKATLAGDIISNTIYYSLIGTGNQKYIWPKAVFAGLTAGLGAISLPKPMGLDSEPVAGSDSKKVLTVSYYVFGALVTGMVLNLISKK